MSEDILNGQLAQSIAEQWFSENRARIEAMGFQTSFERITPNGQGPHAWITFESDNVSGEALIFYEGFSRFHGRHNRATGGFLRS